jgi:hypothetical protein
MIRRVETAAVVVWWLASNDQTSRNSSSSGVVSYSRPPVSTVAWSDWARLRKAAATLVRVPALIRTGHLLGTSKSHNCYSLSQNSDFFSTRGMRNVLGQFRSCVIWPHLIWLPHRYISVQLLLLYSLYCRTFRVADTSPCCMLNFS